MNLSEKTGVEPTSQPIPPNSERAARRVISRFFASPTCTIFLAILLLLVLSYAVRTQAVLGHFIAPHLQRIAAQNHIALEIASIAPDGWTSVRIERIVASRSHHRGAALARIEAIRLTPSLKDLLQGNLRFKAIHLDNSDLWLEGAQQNSTESRPTAPTNNQTALLPNLQKSLARYLTDGAKISTHDLHLHARHFPRLAQIHDLRIETATAIWSPLHTIARATAHGNFPDGAPFQAEFSASQPNENPAPSAPGRHFTLQAPGLALDQFLNTKLPASVRVDAIRWCESCADDEITLENLAVHLENAPLEASFFAPTLHIARSAKRNTAPTAHERLIYANASSSQLILGHSPRHLIAIEQVDFELAPDRFVTGQIRLQDSAGGWFKAQGRWSFLNDEIEFDIQFEDFALHNAHGVITTVSPLHRAIANGRVHSMFDLRLGLLRSEFRTDLRDLTMHLPFLASDNLVFERVGLQMDTLLDLKAKSLSITDGQVRFRSVEPLDFHAQIAATHPGWTFLARVNGQNLQAPVLLDSLPAALTGVLRDARIGGQFDISLHTAGHTMYPDSLILDTHFGGNVEVLRDGRYIDVRVLKGDGQPTTDTSGHSIRTVESSAWVNFEDLPPHIPFALISAEDAAFFKHAGLDWVGLRMAMIHNLRQGTFERGGSTITQQLAKNLFLTHNRTLSRKLQEAFLTWRIESELEKERILELYVNVVEWGPDIHGIQHAAEYYFNTDATRLTAAQMLMLGAILPNPVHFGAALKAGYLPSSRQAKSLRALTNMRFLGHLDWPEYYSARDALNRGQLAGPGDEPFAICADDETAPEGAPSCKSVTDYKNNPFSDTGLIPLSQ